MAIKEVFDFANFQANVEHNKRNMQVEQQVDFERRQRRRANIRAVLGPLPGDQIPAKIDEGRPKYTCRIGDNLIGIAKRHPIICDQEMWRLLALINGLSVETDSLGKPKTKLKRGMTLLLPLPDEIHRYRAGRFEPPKLEA